MERGLSTRVGKAWMSDKQTDTHTGEFVWNLSVILQLEHQAFYVRFQLPQLYLANMSPNFLIVLCIKSLMLSCKITFRFHTNSPACVSVIHPRFAHPHQETLFHADTGTQKVCGTSRCQKRALDALVLELQVDMNSDPFQRVASALRC